MQIPPKTELEDIYKIHRDYLEHEDNLINHRTTWLITIQSFLLATFGFTYQKRYEVAAKLYEHSQASLSALGQVNVEYHIFMAILCVIGVGVSITAFLSIESATLAIKGLKKSWSNVANGNNTSHLPELTAGGDSKAESRGFGMPLVLPIAFGILWILALVYLLAVRFSFSLGYA